MYFLTGLFELYRLSVFYYCLVRVIQSQYILLQLCSSYAQSVTENEEAMFGYLVWLIRDWDNEQQGQRRRYFQELVRLRLTRVYRACQRVSRNALYLSFKVHSFSTEYFWQL